MSVATSGTQATIRNRLRTPAPDIATLIRATKSKIVVASKAKQSMARHRRIEDGLLRRFTPRNDAVGFSHTLLRSRGVKTPELCQQHPQERAQGMPGARCTRSLACKK